MNRWPVFVINMDDNPDRMARAAAELDRLDIAFTRLSAINGRALPAAELAQVYDPMSNARRARHPLIASEIGCYLSHIAVWERIADGSAPGGIVLEDDFAADDTLPLVLDALSADDGDWEIAKLFSLHRQQRVVARRPLAAEAELVIPYKVPTTTLGYAIRRGTAARLAARALPVSRPIDEDHKHFWELDLRVVSVMPPPLRFGDVAAETGSIQSTRRRSRSLRGGRAVTQSWRSMRYRLNYLARLHWNRLLHRRR
jgi:glycosyl transferase family 25